MTHPATSFAPAHLVPLIDQSSADAARAGVILQTADSTDYTARHVEIRGQRLLNFGSCSYLDLEQRRELKEGAIDATRRYGTQFPFPRTYLQSPLYERLESALEAITRGYALVAPSTTLAHIAALPVLVEPGDAVVIDQFAHASLHTATALLRSIPVEHTRHNRTDHAERKITKLARNHRRVWYLVDGLYSMLGDFAPVDAMAALLAEHPQLHAYIDDAHSTSWLGPRGCGYALDRMSDRSRVVVTLSLNKAFGAGGGAVVLPTAELRSKVRRCGGPMMFSGPMQPPMLGAAAASAELHLTPEFHLLQSALSERIRLAQTLAGALGVPLVNADATPIFFVRCGASDVAFGLARTLQAQGIYACASAFPAVPQNQAGIRFTVSLHNTPEDIQRLMETLAVETRRVGVVHEERVAEVLPAPDQAPSGVMRVSRPPPARSPTSSAPPPA
jgi:7-keto-8-aminopelargonate synthetase-like enzyme